MLRSSPALAFVTPAALLFLFAAFVKTAPWGWDNIKLFIWAYLIALPFIWSELILRWPIPVRAVSASRCSGQVSFRFSAASCTNARTSASPIAPNSMACRPQCTDCRARRDSPPIRPTIIRCCFKGRKVVLGYPGHLWTQGFDYTEIQNKLERVHARRPDWREQARALRRALHLLGARREDALRRQHATVGT